MRANTTLLSVINCFSLFVSTLSISAKDVMVNIQVDIDTKRLPPGKC